MHRLILVAGVMFAVQAGARMATPHPTQSLEAGGEGQAAALRGLIPRGVAIGIAADSGSGTVSPEPPSPVPGAGAPVIRSVGCSPLLAANGDTVTCLALVDGPVSSYRWDAPEGHPATGDDDVFFTSFSTHGFKSIRLRVCGGGCSDATEIVHITEPSIYTGQLGVDRGPGATYRAGELIAVCHRLFPQHAYELRLFKKTQYVAEYQIASITDDGIGDCFHFPLSGFEIGLKTYRAEFWIGGELMATASVSIQAVPGLGCTLASQVDPNATTIMVNGCPLVPGAVIRIDQEVMAITAAAPPQYSVSRGTPGATHVAGSAVSVLNSPPGY